MRSFSSSAISRLIVASVGLCCLVTATARAQGTNRFHSLEIPTDTQIRCRAHRLENASSAIGQITRVKLAMGRPETASRSLEAWFDSAGRPLRLTETSLQSSADGTSLGGVTVGFAAGEAAEGFRTQHSMKAGQKSAPGTVRTLTNDEAGEARLLAEWIWRRVCHVNSVSVGDLKKRPGN